MKPDAHTNENAPFSHFFNEKEFLSLSFIEQLAFIRHLSTLLLMGKQNAAADSLKWHPESALGQELGRYNATYISGDGLFDPSFSIDNVGDLNFLGECGISLCKHGNDEVLGFEVWLFDKSDVHTESLLLIPEGKLGVNDEKTEKFVKEKSLPVSELTSGGIYTVESNKLRLQIQITKLELVGGKVQQLSVELISYKKI